MNTLYLLICSTWFVAGGTDSFFEFLKGCAGTNDVVRVREARTVPFETATNSVFFLLPQYKAGARVIPEFSDIESHRVIAALDNGNRLYVENYLSMTNLAHNFSGTEVYCAKPRSLGREYIEWRDILQARRSGVLVGFAHGSNKNALVKETLFVSDCIGVHGIHRPGRHRLPALVESRKGSVVAALVGFSDVDIRFMRPYATWRQFFGELVSKVTGVGVAAVEQAFERTWPDFVRPCGGTDAHVAWMRAVEWHFKSGMLSSADGTRGMHEAIASDDLGYRDGLRTDCHLITAAMLIAAGRKADRADWVATGRNLADFIYAQGAQTKEGFFRWFVNAGDGRDWVYSSDMGRDALSVINLYKMTGDEKYLESARCAAEAFLLWWNGRNLGTGCFNHIEKGGWRTGTVTDNPVFYGEMVSFMLQLGEKRYTDAALATVDRIMRKFPDVSPFGFSDNFTYSRCLVMLACVQRMTDRDYSNEINYIVDFFDKATHASGGVCELPIRIDDDDEAGVGMGDGTDHIADILYCNNFVLNATSVLVKMPEGKRRGIDMPRVLRLYGNVRRFLIASQISSADPKFDGAWMRAYDMDLGEYYGFNKDVGWGPYCIETGWMTGFIPLVLIDEDSPKSFFFTNP